MSAILFGSISTVADTSELQRWAFNQAFAAHGLDWHWDQGRYRTMLSVSGGQARIQQFARDLDQTVDAEAIHKTKSEIFQAELASADLTPRDGVVATITGARATGWKVGLVTTTSRENILAMLGSLSPDIQVADFDVIVDASHVTRPKPDKAAYVFALHSLQEAAVDCVAIEDNIDGVQAAEAAGVTCVAFPNTNTAPGGVAAECQVERLDVSELQRIALGA